MKFRNLFLIFAVAALCLALVSCNGEGSSSDTDTGNVTDTETNAVDTSDLIYTDTEEKKCDIKIAGVDIASFVIVTPADADETATSISEYVVSGIKSFTTLDIPVTNDLAEAVESEIVIGNTSRSADSALGEDEFLIKVEGGKLYILYAEGSSAYQAVTAVLSEVLFSESAAVEGVIDLADGYEVTGKCADYVIGDNEFNPFE